MVVLRILLVLWFCLVPFISWSSCTWDGNTCIVPSCSVADQNTCVTEIKTNALSKTGTVTMQLPECDYTEPVTSVVTVNMTSGFTGITKLIIRGYGTTPPSTSRTSAGLTKIANHGYNVTMSASKAIRISNMTVSGEQPNLYSGRFRFANPSVYPNGGFRLDHIYFDSATGLGWDAQKSAMGVVDSCSGDIVGKNAGYRGDGTDTSGNDEWQAGPKLGTLNAVYVENMNTRAIRSLTGSATNQGILMLADIGYGGRVAVRYSTVTNYYLGGHDASSGQRSGLQLEAYNNYMIQTYDVPNYAAGNSYSAPQVDHRGGTGVIYNNDFVRVPSTGYFTPTAIYFRNNRSGGAGTQSIWVATQAGTCDIDGKKACLTGDWNTALILCTSDATCGGAAGSCQYVDGDGVTTDLPCRDQIGTGDNSTPQASYPFLVWNNREKYGSGDWITSTVTSATTDIAANRDYCEHATTMPSTCNGVTTTYTAYTCPHPATEYTGTCDSSIRGVEGYNIQTYNVDAIAPTLVSAIISPSGLSLPIVLSEDVTVNTNTGFTLHGCSGGAAGLTYVSESGGTLTYTIGRTIYQSETGCHLDYVTGANYIEDAAGNDLDSFSDGVVYNGSTEVETPPARTLTVNKTGFGCAITSTPTGISCVGACASGNTADFENGTSVQLGGWLYNGWSGITYGGDCNGSGVVDMSGGDKTCTVTCTPVYVMPW